MRLVVTGSSRWIDVATVERELRGLDPELVIHSGKAGAEMVADKVARGLSMGVVRCPELPATALDTWWHDRGLAFGALWFRASKSGLWGRTGTGDMVSRLLEARLPVRWVPAPGAEAVELAAMPTPEEHERLIPAGGDR